MGQTHSLMVAGVHGRGDATAERAAGEVNGHMHHRGSRVVGLCVGVRACRSRVARRAPRPRTGVRAGCSVAFAVLPGWRQVRVGESLASDGFGVLDVGQSPCSSYSFWPGRLEGLRDGRLPSKKHAHQGRIVHQSVDATGSRRAWVSGSNPAMLTVLRGWRSVFERRFRRGRRRTQRLSQHLDSAGW